MSDNEVKEHVQTKHDNGDVTEIVLVIGPLLIKHNIACPVNNINIIHIWVVRVSTTMIIIAYSNATIIVGYQ